LLALRRTVAAFDLSPRPFLDLIEANVQDQLVSTYDTWDELKQYCLLSAAPVGRLVLRVFGVRDPRAGTLSDDVCIGLQLANFAQDVAVDRAKGRLYLPQADLRAHGLQGAIHATCERAERLLACGRELEDMVPSRLGVQLALYRLGGMAILSSIHRMGYRTDQERPHVSLMVKAGLVPLAFIQSRRRRGYVRTQRAV
jgi:phytoene/squalene synthetase